MNIFINDRWQSKDYLAHYYSADKLVYDEVLIFKYIYHFLLRFKKNSFNDLLDFGSGPTIHRLIPFTDYINNMYVADYLPENLQEIKLWLSNKNNAHNWDKQIEDIVRIQYRNQMKSLNFLKEKVRAKKIILRSKVKNIIQCDAFSKKPFLGVNKKFDIVTSFYCLDSITESKVKWKKGTGNLLQLVKPGGWVIISALRNTSHYMVSNAIFPSPNINEKDFIKVFSRNKFNLKTINFKIISAKPWLDSGIKSLMILSAQKLK